MIAICCTHWMRNERIISIRKEFENPQETRFRVGFKWVRFNSIVICQQGPFAEIKLRNWTSPKIHLTAIMISIYGSWSGLNMNIYNVVLRWEYLELCLSDIRFTTWTRRFCLIRVIIYALTNSPSIRLMGSICHFTTFFEGFISARITTIIATIGSINIWS